MSEVAKEEWREWSLNKITKEFVNYLKERKQNTLLDQNSKSADWPDFKQYRGRISEINEIIGFIEEQKEDER